ncbi:hypothetical protein V5L23_004148 [Salmonella enterica]
MKAILTAFPQNAAKVTLLRSGNLTHRLRDGQRIMICDVPRQLENAPAGEIPDTGQWLAQEEALQPFFSDGRVINAAGGQEGLKTWTGRIPDCQCAGGDHVRNLTTAQTPDGGAVRLCHACDNVHYMKGYRDLSKIITSNRAEWIVDYAGAGAPDDDAGAVLLGGSARRRRRDACGRNTPFRHAAGR